MLHKPGWRSHNWNMHAVNNTHWLVKWFEPTFVKNQRVIFTEVGIHWFQNFPSQVVHRHQNLVEVNRHCWVGADLPIVCISAGTISSHSVQENPKFFLVNIPWMFLRGRTTWSGGHVNCVSVLQLAGKLPNISFDLPSFPPSNWFRFEPVFSWCSLVYLNASG